jgi:hypothetical protein
VALGLAGRLGRVTGRNVDIAQLDRVEATAPLLLDRVLDEGRVLVDRDGPMGWPAEPAARDPRSSGSLASPADGECRPIG